ncbi:MAG TPA: tRNA epoxyqueuosine(34) reductase QueG [Saprospiraceae bacterium]|nr:tRNA epoxyqueuosine(34) reductase QueG [Saprospiraceae bacterium]HQU55017.1 tRNA epoxyqueuosine(34) reductase QueG [Saprospiraceae bacterium]
MVKSLAQEAGFLLVGIARAERLDREAERLQQWLNLGYQGTMQWMANHFEKRVDPTVLVPGAKSVVCLAYNYYPGEVQQNREAPQVAKYAYGEDYHGLLKKKLKELLDSIRHQYGPVTGRCFVDSAPVLERDWAQRAGLGWIGKNTLLIHPRIGSYFFLAELIIDLELEPDEPVRDHCGTCRKCIDACPTGAIAEEGYLMDGSKCISYLTIELKEEQLPEPYHGKMENWVFGCDICQQVCPWNRFATPHHEPAFTPHGHWFDWNKNEWLEMTEEIFVKEFDKSPLKRPGYAGIRRNLDALNK